MFRRLALVLAAIAVLLSGATVWVSRPAFDQALDPAFADSLMLAPAAEALSFARVALAEGTVTVLAREWRGGRLTAVVAGAADPLELLQVRGYDALQQLAETGPAVEIDPAQLGVPFAARERNIAVGLNYREHAQESSLDEEPFLFPKLGAPTAWTAPIARRDAARLDYEAELGLVALRDLAPGDAPAFGLVLANEVTDRWALVRGFDGDQPMGTTGFADGKSRDGFAPLGPLLVVPRDFESFWPRLRLELWLNGRLRQNEAAAAMIWSPREILAQAFARASVPMRYGAGTVTLLEAAGRVPAGTVFFSGTPAGVIFRPLNLLNPWVYLRPGDVVVVRAQGLGLIRNPIEP